MAEPHQHHHLTLTATALLNSVTEDGEVGQTDPCLLNGPCIIYLTKTRMVIPI